MDPAPAFFVLLPAIAAGMLVVYLGARGCLSLFTAIERDPPDQNRCAACRYDLSGLPELARCPECNSPERARGRARRRLDPASAAWALALFLVGLALPVAMSFAWRLMLDADHVNEPYISSQSAPVGLDASLFAGLLALVFGSVQKAAHAPRWGGWSIAAVLAVAAVYLVVRRSTGCIGWHADLDNRGPGLDTPLLWGVAACITLAGVRAGAAGAVRFWHPAYRRPCTSSSPTTTASAPPGSSPSTAPSPLTPPSAMSPPSHPPPSRARPRTASPSTPPS